MALTPKQKLATAVIRVVDAAHGWAPYFGATMRGLIRCEAPGIRTLAVSVDGRLLWDPEFITRESIEVIAFGLMHEAMHVLFKHFERADALHAAAEPTADPRALASLVNLAQDACINETLREVDHLKGVIPSWAITPEKLEQPAKLTFEERYMRLRQKTPIIGLLVPAVGGGWCGSCAGHPVPGEGGNAVVGRSATEMDRFRRETAQAIQAAEGRNPGSVPGALQRFARATLAPPRVDWRTHLARAIRGAIAQRSGAVDFTWTRSSRRQAGVGFGVGRPQLPAFHAPSPDVACIVDTSGSMGKDELTAAAGEVRGVLQAVGSRIKVCVVDADVQGIREVASINDALEMLKGGGGTDMTPGFEEIAKLKTRPGVIIVLTDGHLGGGHPEHAPVGSRVIWCVVGKHGNKTPCPWGEVVLVDDTAVDEAA